jgi:hypothetical protein
MRMPAPRCPEQVKAVPPSQPRPPWLPRAGGSPPATHCLPALVRLAAAAYYLIVPQCGARHPTGDQRRSLSAAAVGNRSFARKRLRVFTTSDPAKAMFSGLRLRANPSVGDIEARFLSPRLTWIGMAGSRRATCGTGLVAVCSTSGRITSPFHKCACHPKPSWVGLSA